MVRCSNEPNISLTGHYCFNQYEVFYDYIDQRHVNDHHKIPKDPVAYARNSPFEWLTWVMQFTKISRNALCGVIIIALHKGDMRMNRFSRKEGWSIACHVPRPR